MPEEKKRGVSTKKLSSAWREHVGTIPDVESLDFRSERHGAGKAVEFHLSSADDEMLLMAVDDLKQELRSYPGVTDVADSYLQGKKELVLRKIPENPLRSEQVSRVLKLCFVLFQPVF